MPNQGGKANRSGSVLERTVVGTFITYGFTHAPYRNYEAHPNNYCSELLLANAPYTTLYGGKGYTEFLVRSAKYNLNIRIECKWQQSPGSVDEKLPHLYLSCAEAMPENDIIILIDGKGFREGAVDWLKETVTNRKYLHPNSPKNIQVMRLTEFLT